MAMRWARARKAVLCMRTRCVVLRGRIRLHPRNRPNREGSERSVGEWGGQGEARAVCGFRALLLWDARGDVRRALPCEPQMLQFSDTIDKYPRPTSATNLSDGVPRVRVRASLSGSALSCSLVQSKNWLKTYFVKFFGLVHLHTSVLCRALPHRRHGVYRAGRADRAGRAGDQHALAAGRRGRGGVLLPLGPRLPPPQRGSPRGEEPHAKVHQPDVVVRDVRGPVRDSGDGAGALFRVGDPRPRDGGADHGGLLRCGWYVAGMEVVAVQCMHGVGKESGGGDRLCARQQWET